MVLNPASKLAIALRREKVLSYIAKGLTTQQIAKILNYPERTIRRDREMLMRDLKKRMQKYQADDLLLEVEANKRAVLKELWRTYLENQDPNVKLRALKQISDIAQKDLEIYKIQKGNKLDVRVEGISYFEIQKALQEQNKKEKEQ